MFLTFSSTNNEFLVVLWESESRPLIMFEIAAESGIVSKCMPDSEPNSFIMDIIGGIKRNSPNSIQIDIENDRLVYHGPSTVEFISELAKNGINIDTDKRENEDASDKSFD